MAILLVILALMTLAILGVVILWITGYAGFMDAEQIGLRLTLERPGRTIRPSRFFVAIPGFQRIIRTDARELTLDLDRVTFLSKGKVTVTLDVFAQTQVVNPAQALIATSDHIAAVQEEARSAVTDIGTDIDFVDGDITHAQLGDMLYDHFRDSVLRTRGHRLVKFKVIDIVLEPRVAGEVAVEKLAGLDARRNKVRMDAWVETVLPEAKRGLESQFPNISELEMAQLVVDLHGHDAAEDSRGGAVLGLSS